MVNRTNRKTFLKVSDTAKIYERQSSKVKFLQDCLKYRVTPVTCRAGYRPPGHQTSEVWRQLEEVRNRASLDLLRVNIGQEKVEAARRRAGLQEGIRTLLALPMDQQTMAEVEEQVRRVRNRFWRACANTHRMKLRALLMRENREVASSLENTPTLPNSSTYHTTNETGTPPAFPRPSVTSTPATEARRRSPSPSPIHGFPSPSSPPLYGFSTPIAPRRQIDLQRVMEELGSSLTGAPPISPLPPRQPHSPTPPSTPPSSTPSVHTPPRRRRQFVPRNRYKREQVRRERELHHRSLVTNCSSFPISPVQDKLLSRGLNFVPSPKAVNKSLMAARWQRFGRTVRWKEFWHGKVEGQAVTGPKKIFKRVKSNLPPYPPPRHLRTFLQAAADDVFLAPLNTMHPNLPVEEEEAMQELVEAQNRGEYKILPNDKSGGVTVVDLTDYKLVVGEQLSATYTGEDGEAHPYYRRTCHQHLSNLRANAQELVQEGVEAGFIHPEDAKEMVPEEAKPGRYYGLAKVHKARRCWPEVAGGRCPPLRSVVSGSGTVAEGISHWVDEGAKGEVPRLPTYLEDTRHLLQLIQEENENGPQPPGTIPVTLDIVAMYNNVPVDEGLRSFAKLMDKRMDQTIPTSFLVRLMKFVAESSVFVFDSDLFLQLLGVAMGSRSSPTFACLFVGVLEAVMLVTWEVQGGLLPHLLRRFIDDVFFLWRHGEAELLKFIHHLNSSHRTIKFEVVPGESYNFTTKSINYLDLKVWVDEDGFVQTTLYEKPCRVVSYLLPSSSHPGFICRNTPYSLAYRLVRIESTKEGLDRNLAKLQEELVSRGYRPGSVAAAVERAGGLSREVALRKVARPTNQRPVFCLPYDPRLPGVAAILRKRHRALLVRDRDAREYMPEPPLVTYTRTKNIRDLVFRAQVPRIQRGGLRGRPPGFYRCGRRSNCALCLHSDNANSYTCPYTGATVNITQHITCQSAGVYLLFCRKDTGGCTRLAPTYLGICGEGEQASFTTRLAPRFPIWHFVRIGWKDEPKYAAFFESGET